MLLCRSLLAVGAMLGSGLGPGPRGALRMYDDQTVDLRRPAVRPGTVDLRRPANPARLRTGLLREARPAPAGDAMPRGTVTAITSVADFDAKVGGCDTVAVVEYFSPNCRSCRALAPKFASLADEYEGRAAFFAVDNSACRALAKRNAVAVLPSVTLHAGRIGRLAGFACGPVTGIKQTRAELELYLPPATLERIRALPPYATAPLRAHRALLSALLAFSLDRSAMLRGQLGGAKVAAHELASYERAFSWLDRDGDGAVDGADLAAAALAMGPSAWRAADDGAGLWDGRLAAADGARRCAETGTVRLERAAFVAHVASQPRTNLPSASTAIKALGGEVARGEASATVGFGAAAATLARLFAEDGKFGAPADAGADVCSAPAVRAMLEAFDLRDEGALGREAYTRILAEPKL